MICPAKSHKFAPGANITSNPPTCREVRETQVLALHCCEPDLHNSSTLLVQGCIVFPSNALSVSFTYSNAFRCYIPESSWKLSSPSMASSCVPHTGPIRKKLTSANCQVAQKVSPKVPRPEHNTSEMNVSDLMMKLCESQLKIFKN